MTDETSSLPKLNTNWIAQLVRQAGQIGLRHFNDTRVERKADRSLVTEADREIELFLVEQLDQRFPGWAFLGEEYGQRGRSECLWAIDPIDGTAAFSGGLPVWGVSLGLLQGDRVVAGWFYLPLTDELYAAGPNGPATWNDQPIHVAAETHMDRNLLITVPSDAHRHFELAWPGKVRSLGSVAAHIAYVARGIAVGSLVGRPSLWDIAGALAVLQRAGGVARTLSGEAWGLGPMLSGGKGPQPMVVAAPQFLDAVLDSIRLKTFSIGSDYTV
jgi:myo-inositol-1(or 4)-monophosphatase